MANVILNRNRPRPRDPGWRKETDLAKRMLDKPGHYKAGQRDDAKKLLAEFGIKKSEKWGALDE